MSSVTYVHYVPHYRVADFESRGWIKTDHLAATHHGHHAIMMVWGGEGEPPEWEEERCQHTQTQF